MEYKTQKMT